MKHKSGLGRLLRAWSSGESLEGQFLTMLDASIQASSPPRTPSRFYKPSSLTKCLRRSYYEREGATIDVAPANAELIGLGQSGTARHSQLQEDIKRIEKLGMPCRWVTVREYLLKHPQPDVKIEREFGNETRLGQTALDLHLMVDGILELKGQLVLLELKTETSHKWNVRMMPDPTHMLQAAAYSLVLGLTRVLFVYENRDTCKRKAFLVDITEEQRQGIKRHIQSVEAYRLRHALPPRVLTECTYCPYTSICTRAGDTPDVPLEVLLGDERPSEESAGGSPGEEV